MRAVSKNGGFSLIEVLIAVTILLVIVIMGSMVFQETTGAFETGRRKIDSHTSIRNIMGTITRDLAMAVDSVDYPDLGVENEFSQHSMTFLALTGPRSNGEAVDGERNLQKIEYGFNSGVLTRKVTFYKGGSGNWASCGSVSTPVNDFYGKSLDLEITEGPYPETEEGLLSPSLPKYVRLRVQMETEDGISTVSAKSEGDPHDTKGKPIWVGAGGDVD